MADLAPKSVRLAPNGRNPGLFQIRLMGPNLTPWNVQMRSLNNRDQCVNTWKTSFNTQVIQHFFSKFRNLLPSSKIWILKHWNNIKFTISLTNRKIQCTFILDTYTTDTTYYYWNRLFAMLNCEWQKNIRFYFYLTISQL